MLICKYCFMTRGAYMRLFYDALSYDAPHLHCTASYMNSDAFHRRRANYLSKYEDLLPSFVQRKSKNPLLLMHMASAGFDVYHDFEIRREYHTHQLKWAYDEETDSLAPVGLPEDVNVDYYSDEEF